LLPDAALKPAYDKAVWLYVYQDFSHSPADRAAERIALRFGVTSFPHLFLADPETLRVLADTGRTTESFLAAVNRVNVKPAESLAAVEAVRKAEARAEELETKPSVELAKRYLFDDDIVVRFRALHFLGDKDPKAVAARAEDLLAVPSDPFRFEVCRALAKTGEVKAVSALEAMVRAPKDSANPNVLRIEAVKALGACGNADSVAVLRGPATSGNYLNTLTGTAVDALAAIATRHPGAKSDVTKVLKDAYPPPAAPADEQRSRICTALARRVHKALEQLTGKKLDFPEVYDANARARLIENWSALGV
jgi:hypothetical protein